MLHVPGGAEKVRSNTEMKFDIPCIQFASVGGTNHKDSSEKKTHYCKFCSGGVPE